MQQLLHYLDGKWVGAHDLKLSVFDLSVIRGYGVFDFLRTYENKPYLLDDHVDRFFHSAKLLEMKAPVTKAYVKQVILEGVRKNNFEETNIRMIFTGGVGPDSVTPGKSKFVTIFTPAFRYPVSYYSQGIKVITYPTHRTLAEAKSLNYLVGMIALQKARKQKAVEAIYCDNKGNLYEGITSNLFIYVDGVLVTPKEEVLIGITRKVIIRLARNLKIPINESVLNIKDVQTFDEVFITASNKEVMPVVQIDDKKVGNGKIGKITKLLTKEYKKLTKDFSEG